MDLGDITQLTLLATAALVMGRIGWALARLIDRRAGAIQGVLLVVTMLGAALALKAGRASVGGSRLESKPLPFSSSIRSQSTPRSISTKSWPSLGLSFSM